MSLPPARFDPVAPPADGLRLAFAAARRRRTGKAAASGAGFVALVVALALSTGTGTQTLVQQPVPPAGGGGPLPSVLSADPTPTAGPRAAPAPGPRGGPAVAARSGAVRSSPQQARAGAPRVRAQGFSHPAPPVSAPMERYESITVPADVTCPVRKRSENTRGLCTEVYPYTSGQEVTLEAVLCSTETDVTRLSFGTAKELDLVVRSGDQERWRWSVGRDLPATPHALVLDPGSCYTWSTPWRAVDQGGRPLPTGTYTVVAEFEAQELAGPERVATSTYRRS